MTRAAVTRHLDPEHVPLAVVERNLVLGTRESFVQAEADVQGFEQAGFDKQRHALDTADLLIGDERQVESSLHSFSLVLQPSDCLQVLNADTLHVLGSPTVNVAGLVLVRGEGRVGPVLGEHRDHVRVRVEDDGGERGVRPLKSFK